MESIGHLYRALYVYTIGFQDKVRKLIGPIENKHVPLNNVWRAYLAIAETAMKVGFKVQCLLYCVLNNSQSCSKQFALYTHGLDM